MIRAFPIILLLVLGCRATAQTQLADYPLGPVEDAAGRLWFGSVGSGAFMWDGETMTTFPDVPGLTGNEIYSVFEDRDGDMWICATGHGVYRYDGETFELHTKLQPADPDFLFGCNTMSQDRRGRLWFGFAGGVYRLEGDTFVNVTREGPWE